MSIQMRNNVVTGGAGSATMIFAHGFGCDQNMWRYLVPAFNDRFKTVLFDLVGSGKSDLSAYDKAKYNSLHGYAADLLEIVDEFAHGPVVLISHSVSSTIGMLATIQAQHRFDAHVMVGPSPCYINDDDYIGGFSRSDIDGLLDTLESNYLGWSSTMAPVIMGAPDRPELGIELTNSFCRTDPEIAKHFARVTFMSDHREDVAKAKTPALILQSTDDLIAPLAVGEFMRRTLPDSVLEVIDNVGHCPHLSAPSASVAAMERFLQRLR